MKVYYICTSHCMCTHVCLCLCVWVWLCVWLSEKEWELESGASPRDVGFWCFPNQRSGTSSDEDVMSLVRLSFSLELRPHISRYSFVTFFLSVFPCLFVSLLYQPIFAFVCLFLCLSLSLASRLVTLQGSRRSLPVFYEWDVLFTLWIYFCQHWWWTHSVTTLTSSSVALLPPIG